MTKGIITIATPDYLESAKLLAASAKKFSNLPTTLITLEPVEASEFDSIIVVPGDLHTAFAVGLLSSPYDKTAFIYADSLVLSDITVYFDLLDSVDLVTPQAKDFKGLPIGSHLFTDRKMIVKNNLPNVWTNFFLYNKDAVQDLSNTVADILKGWDSMQDSLEYVSDADLKNKINTAFSIAVKASGFASNSYGVTFTNLSKQTNNTSLKHLSHKDWFQLLSFWATDDNLVKIENYNQTGVVHYTSNWLDSGKESKIKSICN